MDLPHVFGEDFSDLVHQVGGQLVGEVIQVLIGGKGGGEQRAPQNIIQKQVCDVKEHLVMCSAESRQHRNSE